MTTDERLTHPKQPRLQNNATRQLSSDNLVKCLHRVSCLLNRAPHQHNNTEVDVPPSLHPRQQPSQYPRHSTPHPRLLQYHTPGLTWWVDTSSQVYNLTSRERHQNAFDMRAILQRHPSSATTSHVVTTGMLEKPVAREPLYSNLIAQPMFSAHRRHKAWYNHIDNHIPPNRRWREGGVISCAGGSNLDTRRPRHPPTDKQHQQLFSNRMTSIRNRQGGRKSSRILAISHSRTAGAARYVDCAIRCAYKRPGSPLVHPSCWNVK